jgi:ribonuclease E
MLINAQNSEELRIAVVEGSNLENYQVEVAERGLTRGNIYRGIVTSIQPGLNAAFIDYGAEKNGFLSMQDILPHAYHRKADGRARIEQVMEKGKPVVVEVTKDAEGTKGAGLTTNISIAGRYIVFTPHDDTRGVSRKLEDEDQRKKLKESVASLKVPDGSGYIIRTNAVGQTKAALSRDLTALLRLWKRIESESRRGKGPALLYGDQDVILRAVRDTLDTSISEVLIDDDNAFAKAQEYIKAFVPRTKTRLVRYTDRAPLFSAFGLDEQIERIYQRQVELPSGGSIVIDRTEALVAIDVNSGRANRGTQAETALRTNLEAATEVARQLRLRDIGGLVVVDFIDMRSGKDDARVEKTLREAMKADRARFTLGQISQNGLLEINRQRIQQALHLRTHRACPTCEGTGRIPSVEMVGLNLLRRIETRAATNPISGVRIALHPELADAFQNTRRREIAALEDEFGIDIEVIASSRLHRPEQTVEWIEREPSRDAEAHAPHHPPAPVRISTVLPVPAPRQEQKAKRGGRGRQKHKRQQQHPPEAQQAAPQSQPQEQPAPPQNHQPQPPAQPQSPEVQQQEHHAVAPTDHPEGTPGPRKRSRRRGRRRRRGGGSQPEAAAPTAE